MGCFAAGWKIILLYPHSLFQTASTATLLHSERFVLHLEPECVALQHPPPITGGLLSREMRATAAAMRLRVPSPHQVPQNFLTKCYENLISTHRWSRANRIQCLRAGTMVDGLPRACRSTKVLTKGYPDLTANNKLWSIEGVIWPKSSWS